MNEENLLGEEEETTELQQETEQESTIVEEVEEPIIETIDDGETLTPVFDIERTKETIIYNANGDDIHIIHEITLGDIAISVLLAATLIFMILDRIIRR